MRTMLLISFALLGTVAARASEPTLCNALSNLKAEAERSNEAERVALIKEEEMTFACRRAKEVAAQDRFCRAALDEIGVEFTHRFPWAIAECLRRQGAHPSLELVDQYTGLRDHKKIRHLWAGWKNGTRIDISYKPLGDFTNDPQFKDYWGEYQLTVWRPN